MKWTSDYFWQAQWTRCFLWAWLLFLLDFCCLFRICCILCSTPQLHAWSRRFRLSREVSGLCCLCGLIRWPTSTASSSVARTRSDLMILRFGQKSTSALAYLWSYPVWADRPSFIFRTYFKNPASLNYSPTFIKYIKIGAIFKYMQISTISQIKLPITSTFRWSFHRFTDWCRWVWCVPRLKCWFEVTCTKIICSALGFRFWICWIADRLGLLFIGAFSQNVYVFFRLISLVVSAARFVFFSGCQLPVWTCPTSSAITQYLTSIF